MSVKFITYKGRRIPIQVEKELGVPEKVKIKIRRKEGPISFADPKVRKIRDILAKRFAKGKEPQGFHYARAVNVLKYNFGDRTQRKEAVHSISKKYYVILKRRK